MYPWGEAFNPEKCNPEESGIGDRTPVGQRSPQGDSAYNCVDMAGNVWEWTPSGLSARRWYLKTPVSGTPVVQLRGLLNR